jgi:hypothetical protein
LQGLVDSAIQEHFDPDIAEERKRVTREWQQDYEKELRAVKDKIDWSRLNKD